MHRVIHLEDKYIFKETIMDINTITETLNHISALSDAISAFIPKAIATASVLSAFLPKPDGDGFLSKLHKWINMAGCNFNQAKNSTDIVSK